jgi:hypothetical protein
MDLLEYQGKQLFAKHGVPVPYPERPFSAPPGRRRVYGGGEGVVFRGLSCSRGV